MPLALRSPVGIRYLPGLPCESRRCHLNQLPSMNGRRSPATVAVLCRVAPLPSDPPRRPSTGAVSGPDRRLPYPPPTPAPAFLRQSRCQHLHSVQLASEQAADPWRRRRRPLIDQNGSRRRLQRRPALVPLCPASRPLRLYLYPRPILITGGGMHAAPGEIA